MTTTTRGCPATDYLRGGANAAASSAPGVTSSAVELTYDPPWTPDMMSPNAKAHLGIGDSGW
jgi:metal-sulfur cluster biosynthetic enzyme